MKHRVEFKSKSSVSREWDIRLKTLAVNSEVSLMSAEEMWDYYQDRQDYDKRLKKKMIRQLVNYHEDWMRENHPELCI